MEEEREEQAWCCYHPRELVIGICSSCLKERLLVVASTQKHQITGAKRPIPKIFALSTFINPFDAQPHSSDDESASSTSHEDSFISIRFESNGVALWDKHKISKISNGTHQIDHHQENDLNALGMATKIKNEAGPGKSHATMRWWKRIGHLLQLIRWRSSAGKEGGDGSHVGKKIGGGKVRHGCMRFLTKRRTKM